MRVVVAADSDSYVKWAIARAEELPRHWNVSVGLLRSAVTPTEAQLAAAGTLEGATFERWQLSGLLERLDDADAAVLAMRGPLIELVVAKLRARGNRRTALAAGIPGIWFPPTERGLIARDGVDLMIVHSVREREAVAAARPSMATGLSHLTPRHASGARRGEGAVVFAPQALVPATRTERLRLLRSLVATASAHPEVPIIIKTRGLEGEPQTHHESVSYEALARSLDVLPSNLSFQTGALADFLPGARGFVTVSSTAAIEAVAGGVPTLVLRDFGVGEHTITEVFRGSGLMGSLAELEALEFHSPIPDWNGDNYFHDIAADDWVEQLEASVLKLARRRDTVRRAAWRGWAARRQAMGAADPLPVRAGAIVVGTFARASRRLVANLRFRSLRLRR